MSVGKANIEDFRIILGISGKRWKISLKNWKRTIYGGLICQFELIVLFLIGLDSGYSPQRYR